MNINFRQCLLKAASIVCFLTGLPALAAAEDPYGVWMRPSTGTQVDFYDCGGKLCGKIVAVKDQARKGEVGTIILKEAAKSGDNQWKGSLLDTDNGKTYSGVVTLRSRTALHLEGCVAFLCEGETWSKVR